MRGAKRWVAVLATAMLFGAPASAVPPSMIWVDVRDEGFDARAWDMTLDEWGNVIVVSDGFGSHGCTTTKYDKFGNVMWSDVWGVAGDFCTRVATGKYGTVFVGGHDGDDFRVIKYSGGGALGWVTSPGSPEQDLLTDLVVDAAGQAIGVGQFGWSYFESQDAAVLKWASSGLEDWRWVWIPGNSRFWAAAVGPDDSIVATGESNGAALTVKLSAAGVLQWVRNGDPGTVGYAVAVDSAGNVIVTGAWDDVTVPVHTVRTWAYNASGTPLWDDTSFPDPEFVGRDVAVDAAGNAYVVADSEVSGKPVLAVRYLAGGARDWIRTFDSPATLDHANEARVDGAGNLHVGVTAEHSSTYFKAWLLSWDPDGVPRWEIPFTWHDSTLAGIDVYGTHWVVFSGSARTDSTLFTDVLTARFGGWLFDDSELDWTWMHAQSWLKPGGNSGKRKFQGDPSDWMSFHAHAGESYDILAQPTGSALDGVRVTLLSPDAGSVLASAMPEGDETLLRFTAGAAGTYHLQFEPASGVTGDDTDYTVDVAGNARVSSLFSRTLPNGTVDAGFDAVQLQDGGIAAIGETGSDALLARLDPLGEPQWTLGYGTSGTDRALAALPTRNGTLAVIGETTPPGDPADAFGMEIDPATGDVLNAWTLGGGDDDRLNAIAHEPVQPPSAGFPPDPVAVQEQGWIAAGLTRSFGRGGDDGLLLRADNDGNPIWALALGGAFDEHVEAVAKTPDDGIVAVGPVADRAWVARFEMDGRLSWAKSFGTATRGDLVPRGIAALSDGSFVIAGYGPSASGLPESDLWVARFDPLGFPRWSRMLVADGDQSGMGVEELVDGNLVIVGSTQDPGGDRNGWIVQLDREGEVLSQRSYGGPADDVLRSVRRREGLGSVVAGTRGDPGGEGETDAWLLALGMEGELAEGCTLVSDTSATAIELPLTAADPEFVATPIEPVTVPWDVRTHAEPVPDAPECMLLEPGEVTGLRFTSKTDLEWNPAADVDRFFVMRGERSALPEGDYGELLEEVGTTRGSDPAMPAVGQVWHYLIRGGNALGTGPAGIGPDGIPRGFPPGP